MSGLQPVRRDIDDVRPMTDAERTAMMQALGHEPAAFTGADGLHRLQWAFLKYSPFHNIELLAGVSPRTVDQTIAAVVAGRGGPCHVQATAFLALLRSLGFDAHLAAATITEASDHMVVLVRDAGGDVICDVGNGHPYRVPFRLNGRTSIDHLGWYFVADGSADGLTLRRRLDDGTWKRVYVVEPRPRPFSHFRSIIDQHHECAGYGPFLTGLRAVRMFDDLLLTLRDRRYRRYFADGLTERRVPDRTAIERLLRHTFGYRDVPVREALHKLGDRADSWVSIARRKPAILMSLSATDRPDNLQLLLDSLIDELARTSAPFALSVVENSCNPDCRQRNRALLDLARGRADLAIHVSDDGHYGRPIAASRQVQTDAIRRLHDRGQPIDVVWMVDDDIVLEQLCYRDGGVQCVRELRYLKRMIDMFNERPDISVAIGGVTGAPPIRPEAVLRTQLFDLVANLERMAAMAPANRYQAPDQAAAFAVPDYYYDHTRAGTAHLTLPFFWLPRRTRDSMPGTVRDETLAFLRAMPGAFVGETPTRPLLHDPSARIDPVKTNLLRGGHALFFDLDAALRHRYPCVDLGTEVTRRSDMLGTTLLHRAGGTWVGTFPVPVRHVRAPSRPMRTQGDCGTSAAEAILSSLRAEFFGVLLTRALMDEELDLAGVASRRRRRIVDSLCVAANLADAALAALVRAESSWMGDDVELLGAMRDLRSAIGCAQDRYLGGREPSAQRHWRTRVDRALACEESYARVVRAAADLGGHSRGHP